MSTRYRGPSVRLLETDATIDGIRWPDAGHFEIRHLRSQFAGGGTQIVQGIVGGAVRVDTVPGER